MALFPSEELDSAIDLPDGNDMAALMGVVPLVICYLISFVIAGTSRENHHLLQVRARRGSVIVPGKPLIAAEKPTMPPKRRSHTATIAAIHPHKPYANIMREYNRD